METKKNKHVDIKTVLLMIWIFIKATVIPKYTYRFRNMYLFFPIILLIVSWVLIPIPIQVYISKNGRSEFRNRNINNIGQVYNLSDEEFNKIKGLNIRFEMQIMYADDETIDAKELVLTNGNNKLYVVVDLCELDQTKESTVHYDYVNFFDSYVNEEGTNTLLVLYNSKFLLRTSERSNYYEYKVEQLNVNNITKEEFANFLADAMITSTLNTYGWYAALYTIIIPLAAILLTYLIFKSSARISTFRNYLNVGGIASIIPTILVFVFSWVFPKLSLMQYYSYIYLAYYVFFICIICFKKQLIKETNDVNNIELGA